MAIFFRLVVGLFFMLVSLTQTVLAADANGSCLAPFTAAADAVASQFASRHAPFTDAGSAVVTDIQRIVHVYITNVSSTFYGNQSKGFKVARRLAESLGSSYHVYLVASDYHEYSELGFFSSQASGIKNLSFTSFEVMRINPKLAKPDHIVAVGDIPSVPSLYSPLMDLSGVKSYNWIAIFGTSDDLARGLVNTANFEIQDKVPPGVEVNYIKTGFYPESEGIISEKINRAEINSRISCDSSKLVASKNASLRDMVKSVDEKLVPRIFRDNAEMFTKMLERPWALAYTRGDNLDLTDPDCAGLPVYLHELFLHNPQKPFFMPFLIHNTVRFQARSNTGVLDMFQQALVEYSKSVKKPLKVVLWNPYKDNKNIRTLTNNIMLRAKSSSGFLVTRGPKAEKGEFSSRVRKTFSGVVYDTSYGDTQLITVHGNMPANILEEIDEYNVVLLQPATLSYTHICQLLDICAHRDGDGKLTQSPVLGTGDNFFSEALLRGIPVMHDGNLGAHHFQVPFELFEMMKDFARQSQGKYGPEIGAKIGVFAELSTSVARPVFRKYLKNTKDRFADLQDASFSRFLLDFAYYLDRFDAVSTMSRQIRQKSGAFSVLEAA